MVRFLTILTVVLAVVASSSMAFAGGNTGCGIGSMIFEGKSGLLSQELATTTNAIFANQGLGITTGTLGCSQFSGIVSNEKVQVYVSQNMDNLANDISEGNGEYLNTLAILLEVKEEDKAEFNKKLQSNFSNIYTSNEVTSKDVVNNIDKVLNQS